MIWIILAALGIPLWMVFGALAATLVSRRNFKRQPGVFPVSVRVVSGEVGSLKPSFPRRPAYARWIHDVLLVQGGVALVRTGAVPVAKVKGQITSRESSEIRGLGEAPLVITLELDSGAVIELAAPAGERDAMAGPFATTR